MPEGTRGGARSARFAREKHLADSPSVVTFKQSSAITARPVTGYLARRVALAISVVFLVIASTVVHALPIATRKPRGVSRAVCRAGRDHAVGRGARGLRRRPRMPRPARRGHRCCCHLWHEGGERLVDPTSPRAGRHAAVPRGAERRAPLDVALTFPGLHNAQNACAALIVAEFRCRIGDRGGRVRGLPWPARRFQILGEVAGVAVVDDYAHHPTEVAAAIDAARQRYRDAA